MSRSKKIPATRKAYSDHPSAVRSRERRAKALAAAPAVAPTQEAAPPPEEVALPFGLTPSDVTRAQEERRKQDCLQFLYMTQGRQDLLRELAEETQQAVIKMQKEQDNLRYVIQGLNLAVRVVSEHASADQDLSSLLNPLRAKEQELQGAIARLGPQADFARAFLKGLEDKAERASSAKTQAARALRELEEDPASAPSRRQSGTHPGPPAHKLRQTSLPSSPPAQNNP